jgi:hypothetical protein
MSKKINITIPNKVKPNLVDLFHKYLFRKAKEPKANMDGHEGYLFDDYEDMADYWDNVFPGWDEDLDNDGDVVVFPPSNVIYMNSKKGKRGKDKNTVYDAFWQQEREEQFGKKGKHKHNKKGKKAKIFNISAPYSGDETDPDEYDFDFTTEDYDSESKEIWFYPDYHCKDDKLEFNSLKEFSDYCESMGYFVDKEVAADISWRYESHCCLNPESEKIGLLEIMSEYTYGEMFYEACEEHELGD